MEEFALIKIILIDNKKIIHLNVILTLIQLVSI